MKVVVFVNGLLTPSPPNDWFFKVDDDRHYGMEVSLHVPKEIGAVKEAVQIQLFSDDGLFKGVYVKDDSEPYEEEIGWRFTHYVLVHRMSCVK